MSYSDEIARWLDDDGKPSRFAWPGGYEIVYVTDDRGLLCAECASLDDIDYNDPDDAQWHIVGAYTLEGDARDHGYPQCDHCYRDFFEDFEQLAAQGFTVTDGIIGCDGCQVVAIQGMPTHETGCEFQTHECRGCDAHVSRNVRYCEDCN